MKPASAIHFLAQRNPETKRWTGIAMIPANDGTKREKVLARTPDNFPTKREALKAIKERV